jgi:hypothetical protein
VGTWDNGGGIGVLNRSLLVLFVMMLNAAPGMTQVVIPDSIPRCPESSEPAPAGWQEVVFGTVALRVPDGFLPSTRAVGIDHGGQEWVREPIAVRAINGFFGLASFRAIKGTRCVAETRGRQVLLIEDVTSDAVFVTAWYPNLGPMFDANSSRPDDIKLIRQILLSASARSAVR